jgi:hypothetical protein
MMRSGFTGHSCAAAVLKMNQRRALRAIFI